MSRLGPLLLVAAALAALLWMLGGERDGRRATEPVVVAPAQADLARRPAPSAPVLDDRRAGPTTRVARPAEALEPAPVASAHVPHVWLSGRLVDAASAGVAGVGLAFFPVEEGLPSRLPARAGARAAATATTDAGGRFELAVPASVAGELALARGSDWLFAQRSGRGRPVAALVLDTDLGDLEVRSAASLAGRVVGADSEPVAGATIRVFPLTGGGPGTRLVEHDLRSSARGEFVVRGLDGGRYWIEVRAEQRVPVGLELTLAAGERRDDLAVVLPSGWRVEGVVLDQRGEPIADARVAALWTFRLSTGGVLERADPAPAAAELDGSFALGGLADASARLVASAPYYEDEVVQVVAGERPRIVLTRRGAIEGRLVDARGGGVAGSQVRAVATVASPPAPSSRRAPVAPTATTGDEGRFSLADLSAGEYVVRAAGSGHPDVVSEPVTVELGVTVAGVLLVAGDGAALTLVVSDAEGSPISDAVVGLARQVDASSAASGGAPPGWSTRGRTDEGGRWSASGLPHEELQVTVEHADFVPLGPRPLWPAVGAAPEVALTLERGARLEVRVVDPSGASAAGVAVRVRGPLGGGADALREARTDGDGNASFGSLAAGDYEVSTWSGVGPAPSGGAHRAERLFVPAGETVERTFVRAAPVTLTGVVRSRTGAPVVGAEVRALEVEVAEAGRPRVARSAGDGRYELEGLAPGRWRLRCSAPPFASHVELELDVPPGVARVERDIELGGGAVAVQVVDEAGTPVSGAALRLAEAGGAPAPWPGGRIDLSRLAHGATDEHGRATLAEVTAGEYTLFVEAPGHAPARVPVAVRDGERSEIGPLELVRGGLLVMQLDERRGGWGVEVRGSGSDESTVVLPGAAGPAPLRLAPGRYELRVVAAPDPARAERPATSWSPFEIRSDEETSFDLRPLATEVEAASR